MNITNLIDIFVNFKRSKKLLSLGIKGYLLDVGWLRSLEEGVPVDLSGSPVPWVTYPFIDFISERLNNNHCVFEFGSGNSTKFYATKAKYVYAVEHDEKWVQYLQKNDVAEQNVELQYVPLEKGYAQALEYQEDPKKYDVVIVDGRERVTCIKSIINVIKDSAIIVLDDSERERYKEATEILSRNEYKKIDFFGLAPNVTYKKCTTVFYKSNNVFNI